MYCDNGAVTPDYRAATFPQAVKTKFIFRSQLWKLVLDMFNPGKFKCDPLNGIKYNYN